MLRSSQGVLAPSPLPWASLCPLQVALFPPLVERLCGPSPFPFPRHYAGPPGYACGHPAHVSKLCVHTFPLASLVWAPGTIGRAQVVLRPCFRVRLECPRPAGICVPLCVSLTRSPAAVPGPWHGSLPQEGRHRLLPSRLTPAGGASAPSRRGAATPLCCCGRRACSDPRDHAQPGLRLREPQDPSGCSERETETQKGEGTLLRSEHQSQIPAHHTPSPDLV